VTIKVHPERIIPIPRSGACLRQQPEIDTYPYRVLAAAIVLQAIRDFLANRPCCDDYRLASHCRPGEGWHSCSEDAWRWLNSPAGRGLIELLGVDPDAALAALTETAQRRWQGQRPAFIIVVDQSIAIGRVSA
jgi:hypothetical protein